MAIMIAPVTYAKLGELEQKPVSPSHSNVDT